MSNAPTPIGRIMLKNVRLAFASGLFEASTIPGQDNAKPKFNCGLILPPDHPQKAQLEAIELAVAKDKWKDKGVAMANALRKGNKAALHDGDLKPNYDGYPGNFFLSPSLDEQKGPPTLLATIDGQNVQLDLATARRKIYSGCYVNASIELWAQDNQYGQRINAQLRGVQFLRDGEAFGGGVGTAGADEFDVTEGADAADFV